MLREREGEPYTHTRTHYIIKDMVIQANQRGHPQVVKKWAVDQQFRWCSVGPLGLHVCSIYIT